MEEIMRQLNSGQESRQRLIRLIHVAKRDLVMEEDVYRDILKHVGGEESSKDLTLVGLEKVLHHMKNAGFRVRRKKPQTASNRPLADDPQSKKIRALWLSLHEAGAVKNPSEAALAAYVKRITGVDALQWISSEQASRVIETLKQWVNRISKGG
jgi:phage gp16-like protein